MINLGPDGEQSSQLIEMIRKFPTTAFLAGRLKEVGWESDYGQCLLTQFREDLVQECGDELSKGTGTVPACFVRIFLALGLERPPHPCSLSRSRTFRRSTQVRDRSA